MAKKSSQTFAKRQKEMARKEKAARKAQRRFERSRQRAARALLPPETEAPAPESPEEA